MTRPHLFHTTFLALLSTVPGTTDSGGLHQRLPLNGGGVEEAREWQPSNRRPGSPRGAPGPPCNTSLRIIITDLKRSRIGDDFMKYAEEEVEEDTGAVEVRVREKWTHSNNCCWSSSHRQLTIDPRRGRGGDFGAGMRGPMLLQYTYYNVEDKNGRRSDRLAGRKRVRGREVRTPTMGKCRRSVGGISLWMIIWCC